MAVLSLTPRDRELAVFFKRNGFRHPYLMVEALRRERIKPQTAAALLEKESDKGRNIFGCDFGGSERIGRLPYCHDDVTELRARALRESGFSNGVGPTQLTFKGYIDMARRAGGEWRPFINMRIGFRIFKNLARTHGSIWEAAKAYNGANTYADDFVNKRDKWTRTLRAAGFKV